MDFLLPYLMGLLNGIAITCGTVALLMSFGVIPS
jgi:hypothetical protein